MLVKFNTTDEQDYTLNELKQHFDVGTASKACSFASLGYMALHRQFIEESKKADLYLNKLMQIADALNSKQEAQQLIDDALHFDLKD